MRPRAGGPALAAWSAFALTTAMAAGTVVFGFVLSGTPLPEDGGVTVSGPGDLSFGLMVFAFGILGAVVASRRPRNPIGWILCVAPLCLAYTGVARGWYVHAYYAEPAAANPPDLFMWALNIAWIPGFMPLLTLLLLLFPDGRPASRRWRPVAWLAGLAMSVLVLGFAFSPGPLEDNERVINPLGASGWAADAAELCLGIGFPLFALTAVLSMASLVVRFRRSAGVERQQLKWMAAAAALVVFAWLVNAFFDQLLHINSSFFLPIVILALPVAAAVAVLRYRLYDLDLVVNRALVYGALTATLLASYLGGVLLLQLALGPLTEDNGLAIAGSTLAAAALVRPARSRIQALVDRRFYRRKYDAARTLESFGGRLRDEIALDSLSAELRGVVADTMQPAHVSLWLRPEGGR